MLTFRNVLPNLRERGEEIKITYMCDNARKRIKIQINKRENIGTRVLQRVDIFRVRPTHQGLTPHKGTISENNSKCSQKQENNITEGLIKSVSTRASGSRTSCHLTDFNETLPV